MNTKTETMIRLRQAIALVKETDGSIPNRPITEVQTRFVPAAVVDPADYEADPADDLMDFWNINSTPRWMPDEIREEGAIVHISFSHNDPFWGPDLITTVTVWLGTADRSPELIHVPGSARRIR